MTIRVTARGGFVQQCCINNYKHIHTAVRCASCSEDAVAKGIDI
jgi:hypothetical protein